MIKKLYQKILYPKLFLLIATLYLGRMVATDENNFYIHPLLDFLGYGGTFLAGILLAYGFTFGPAVGALLYYATYQNFFWAGLIATLGAMLGNFLIFRLIKISLEDELTMLAQKKNFQRTLNAINDHTPRFVQRYLLPIFAGIIAATPLPEEISVALIAAAKNLSFPIFSIVAFIFSVFGIFILLALGRIF